jgi:hypothetical protein
MLTAEEKAAAKRARGVWFEQWWGSKTGRSY